MTPQEMAQKAPGRQNGLRTLSKIHPPGILLTTAGEIVARPKRAESAHNGGNWVFWGWFIPALIGPAQPPSVLNWFEVQGANNFRVLAVPLDLAAQPQGTSCKRGPVSFCER